MKRDIWLLDNISIVYDNDNIDIFNIVYKEDMGLYLYVEDKPLIRNLTISDSRLITHYNCGFITKSESTIKNIMIDDNHISKLPWLSPLGNLLIYDEDMAHKYNLDEDMACDCIKFKKRIKEEQ